VSQSVEWQLRRTLDFLYVEWDGPIARRVQSMIGLEVKDVEVAKMHLGD
jgi:hypothetical protein